jgi:hypothetical protein
MSAVVWLSVPAATGRILGAVLPACSHTDELGRPRGHYPQRDERDGGPGMTQMTQKAPGRPCPPRPPTMRVSPPDW